MNKWNLVICFAVTLSSLGIGAIAARILLPTSDRLAPASPDTIEANTPSR